MYARPLSSGALLALVPLVAGLAPGARARADVTHTYKNGVDGYAGNVAVNISSLGLTSSGYGQNGTTFTDGGEWCIGDLPDTMGYDISPLLRFEELESVPGHHVASATLRLRVVWWESGAPSVVVRYLAVPWGTTPPGDDGVGVGWRTREVGVPWSALGAEGEGTDVVALTQGESAPLTQGESVIEIALDPVIVSAWLDPAQNHGVVLRVSGKNQHVGFFPPLTADVANRPELEILFVPGEAPVPEDPSPVDPSPSAPSGGGCTASRHATSGEAALCAIAGAAALTRRRRRRESE